MQPARDISVFVMAMAACLALPIPLLGAPTIQGLGAPGVHDIYYNIYYGDSIYLTSVSADGSTVVGGHGSEAFRWTAQGGTQNLGIFAGADPGGYSYATGVSTDGRVVVGASGDAGHPAQAFRWSVPGGQILGFLYGGRLASRRRPPKRLDPHGPFI